MVIQWLRLRAPNAGGQVLIPDEGTTSHIPQLKIPHATTETWSSQINIFKNCQFLNTSTSEMLKCGESVLLIVLNIFMCDFCLSPCLFSKLEGAFLCVIESCLVKGK